MLVFLNSFLTPDWCHSVQLGEGAPRPVSKDKSKCSQGSEDTQSSQHIRQKTVNYFINGTSDQFFFNERRIQKLSRGDTANICQGIP